MTTTKSFRLSTRKCLRLENDKKNECSKDVQLFLFTVCSPKHETIVGIRHGGQGNVFRTSRSFSFCAQGVAIELFVVSSLTKTESWQTTGHECEHVFNGKSQICWQFGQSLKWQRCGWRSWWWQFDGFLKFHHFWFHRFEILGKLTNRIYHNEVFELVFHFHMERWSMFDHRHNWHRFYSYTDNIDLDDIRSNICDFDNLKFFHKDFDMEDNFHRNIYVYTDVFHMNAFVYILFHRETLENMGSIFLWHHNDIVLSQLDDTEKKFNRFHVVRFYWPIHNRQNDNAKHNDEVNNSIFDHTYRHTLKHLLNTTNFRILNEKKFFFVFQLNFSLNKLVFPHGHVREPWRGHEPQTPRWQSFSHLWIPQSKIRPQI